MTVTQADRNAAASLRMIQAPLADPRVICGYRDGKLDDSDEVQAFAAHLQAVLLEGVRIGIEVAAKMADEWRDENRKNVSKSRHSSNMSDMLEGAAIECNALAQEFRKFDPAAVLARHGGA